MIAAIYVQGQKTPPSFPASRISGLQRDQSLVKWVKQPGRHCRENIRNGRVRQNAVGDAKVIAC